MGYETIIVERKEHIGLITLNRPEQLNTFTSQLAPLYDVSVYQLMAAAGYLDEAQSIKYKCLNPDCGRDFETRGADPLRCPYCGTGYVLDWATFDEIVIAEANWLEDPVPPLLIAKPRFHKKGWSQLWTIRGHHWMMQSVALGPSHS